MSTSRLAPLLLTLCGLSGTAGAQVFTDELSFRIASGFLGVESFECFPTGAVASADPIDTPAFGMTIVPAFGSTLAPMNVQSAPNPSGPHATDGTRFVQLGATPSTNGQFSLTITFAAPIEEFGFTFTDFGEYVQLPGSLTATVLGTTYVLASNPPVQPNAVELFWGLRSPGQPFTTIVVQKSTEGDGMGIDELLFSDLGLPDHCSSRWTDLGGGLGSTSGLPALSGIGCLTGGEQTSLVLTAGAPHGTTWLVIGASELGAPFKGGTLWPNPDILLAGLPLNAAGALTISLTWPVGLPSGVAITWQHWLPTPANPTGWSASNGLRSTQP